MRAPRYYYYCYRLCLGPRCYDGGPGGRLRAHRASDRRGHPSVITIEDLDNINEHIFIEGSNNSRNINYGAGYIPLVVHFLCPRIVLVGLIERS